MQTPPSADRQSVDSELGNEVRQLPIKLGQTNRRRFGFESTGFWCWHKRHETCASLVGSRGRSELPGCGHKFRDPEGFWIFSWIFFGFFPEFTRGWEPSHHGVFKEYTRGRGMAPYMGPKSGDEFPWILQARGFSRSREGSLGRSREPSRRVWGIHSD